MATVLFILHRTVDYFWLEKAAVDHIGQGLPQNMASKCFFSSHCSAEFLVVLRDADSANSRGNLLQYSTNVIMEKMFHNIYLEFSLFQCLFSSILHNSLALPYVESLIT